MAGHGSPPPGDRARHPGRQVGRPMSARASDLAQIGQGSIIPSVNEMASGMMSQREPGFLDKPRGKPRKEHYDFKQGEFTTAGPSIRSRAGGFLARISGPQV